MDDPWQHIPPLATGAPRRHGCSDRTVRILLVTSILLLALMPILILAMVLIIAAIR